MDEINFAFFSLLWQQLFKRSYIKFSSPCQFYDYFLQRQPTRKRVALYYLNSLILFLFSLTQNVLAGQQNV